MSHLTKSEDAIMRVLDERSGEVVTYAALVIEALGYSHPGTRPELIIRAHASNMRIKGAEFGVMYGCGLYVGERPCQEKPKRETICGECGTGFLQEPKPGRQFRYCEQHRGGKYAQRRYSRRRQEVRG